MLYSGGVRTFMPTPLKVLQPSYVDEFNCLRTNCDDTCCAGWGVVIDKATFEKYQKCTHLTLRPMMDAHIIRDPASTSDQTYSRMEMPEGHCPFLTERKLCSIQREMGAENLSRACQTFPRAMNVVDGVVERSFYLSCPEATRLVLLNPN